MLTNPTGAPLGLARGFPPSAEGLLSSAVGAQRWRLPESFSTPIAVLDADALAHNAARMARWCTEHGVQLMPHGKTTMAPALFNLQLEHGAVGITAATPAQVRFMYAAGVRNVQLANQFVQPRDAAWIAGLMARDPNLGFSCWVDSEAGVAILNAAGREAGVVFDTYLEIGAPGGRTGCRTEDARSAVVSAVQQARHVRLRGVAAWEGAYAGTRDPDAMERVREYLRSVRSAAVELSDAGAAGIDGPLELTAGGSMFFDVVVAELGGGWGTTGARVVLRSGCYLTHDHGLYHGHSPLDGDGVDGPLRPALTVWGSVLSRPEPELALLDVGRRDVSFDQGLPVPIARVPAAGYNPTAEPLTDATITALNDQHAFVSLPPTAKLQVGDRVQLGISHPCTTFDKWRVIPVVRGATVTDVVHTYF